MRLPDGREHLLTFGLPLDLTLVGQLMTAVAEAAGRLGYTNVHIAGDGLGRGCVYATPPTRPVVLPSDRIPR